MNKKLLFLIALGLVILGAVFFLRASSMGTTLLWSISNNGRWLFPLVVVSAFIDSFHPCAFSILLLTIAFLISIGSLRSNVLRIGGFYVAGIFLVYLMIGLGILQVLHLFNTPHFMAKAGATLLIILGIVNIINEFFPQFPVKLHIPHAAHRAMAALMEKASLPTAFLLGGLVGLCSFPCVGGPYLMVLGLLHDQVTYFRGLSYLILYNLIFVLPLVIVLLIASDRQVLEKVQIWQQKERRSIKLSVGLAAIILGIIIFFL